MVSVQGLRPTPFQRSYASCCRALTLSMRQIFGLQNPEAVKKEIPKEWKAGTWRISKVPDPACKVDPMPEQKFLA